MKNILCVLLATVGVEAFASVGDTNLSKNAQEETVYISEQDNICNPSGTTSGDLYIVDTNNKPLLHINELGTSISCQAGHGKYINRIKSSGTFTYIDSRAGDLVEFHDVLSKDSKIINTYVASVVTIKDIDYMCDIVPRANQIYKDRDIVLQCSSK